MAEFIPSLNTIRQFKVQPTQGEWALLSFLDRILDDSFEVYFNPFLNGDRPDVVILKKYGGAFIIEVKDWNLDLYKLDQRKHWHLAHPKNKGEEHALILSPIDQCLRYKKNLFELHVENLLERYIRDSNLWGVVTCGVYFHNATQKKVEDLILPAYSTNPRDEKFIDHTELIGSDGLEERSFKERLRRHYMLTNNAHYFDDGLYASFHRLLLPPLHTKDQGKFISRFDARLKKQDPSLFMYSKKQDELIFDKQKRQQWRIKGVVGSGKTTLLAAKAVQAYKELIESGIKEPKILILTFNITLKNFIHDKLQQVNEEFNWGSFLINNYHKFIRSQFNNLGIIYHRFKDETDEEFFKRYYDNYNLFIPYDDRTERFDVIFIDEIQDYKREWMDIIKDFFLIKEGEYPRGGYYLLGDAKQNIYTREISHKDVATNVLGVHTLDSCFRSDWKIKDLALGFQQKFFNNKYEVDTSLFSEEDSLFSRQNLQQGSINYKYLKSNDWHQPLFSIIHNSIENEFSNVSINDITVLGTELEFLRFFDTFYRYRTRSRTSTMFESYEMMFMNGFNKIRNEGVKKLNLSLCNLINKNKSEQRSAITKFIAAYELYEHYPSLFKVSIDLLGARFGFDTEELLSVMNKYKEEYSFFKKKVLGKDFSKDYEKIRENKKIHFWMNSGNIKISTVHSFKGWESDTVFLLLPPVNHSESFEELIYTGLTRARSNLFIINLGNDEYHENMKTLVDAYK